MKKKLLSIVLAVAMTGTMLAGCGQGKETAQTGGEAPGETVTLKTISMFGGTDPNAPVYDAIIEEFMQEHENVVIEDNSAVADNEWKAAVVADFSVGNEPDVLQYFTDAMADNIVATDKLVTFDEIKAEYPEYAQDTLPEVLDFVANSDGVKRAVPTTGFMEVLYCNKDLFDQYNLELPTDWDSFVKAVEVFHENGVIPIAVSLNNIPHYWIEAFILYSAGLESYQEVPKTAPADWAKGLDLFKQLRDMGAFPEDTDTVDNDYIGELFKNKQAAMQYDGTWYAGGIPDAENTIAVPFPGVPDQKVEPGTMTAGFSSGFYITRKAWEDPAKRDLAVQFVMAQTNKEAITRYWEKGGYVNKTAVQMDSVDSLSPLAASILDCANAAGENFAGPIDSRMDAEAFTTIVNGIVNVSSGSQSSEDLLNEALSVHASRQE